MGLKSKKIDKASKKGKKGKVKDTKRQSIRLGSVGMRGRGIAPGPYGAILLEQMVMVIRTIRLEIRCLSSCPCCQHHHLNNVNIGRVLIYG